MRYKKSMHSPMLLTLSLLVIVLIIGAWLFFYFQRECNDNEDCGQNQYCGSDFECHDFPNAQPNFTTPAWIVGASVVGAALILRWENIKKLFAQKKKKSQEITPTSLDEYEDESSLSQK